jgi:hypothetical protein
MDFAVLEGKTETQWRQYESDLRLGYERDAKMMEAASRRVLQELELQSRISNQRMDNTQKERIAEYKRRADEAARKKKNKARMTGAIIMGGITIASVLTGGFGAAALLPSAGAASSAAGAAAAAAGTSAAASTAATAATTAATHSAARLGTGLAVGKALGGITNTAITNRR